MSHSSSREGYNELDNRYAIDDMSNHGRWDRGPSPEKSPTYPSQQRQLQMRKVSRSVTAPIPTPSRTDSETLFDRPSSSGGKYNALAYRSRRSDPFDKPEPANPPIERSPIKTVWPPPGCRRESVMPPKEAQYWVGDGANTFTGSTEDIPNAPYHYRFFAVMDKESESRTDCAEFEDDAFRDMSLALTGSVETARPWSTLEQPCMAHCFGRFPGTTTLNFRVSKSGCTQPPMSFGANVQPRKIKLLHVLDRLRKLEKGLDHEDPDESYKYLYKTLIEDPEKYTNPHYGLEQQIVDLITVLTNPDWVDFSNPKHQVVAKFFDSHDALKRQKFFHQLLLSVELYHRIHSRQHETAPKQKVLQQLPPKVAWDMAVAKRWLDNMEITREEQSSNKSTFSYDYPSKSRQKEALRKFASLLKWPNMDEIDYILEEKDHDERDLEGRSADTMSWFTGVVLPGPTLPWLLMNSVIDCDKEAGDALKVLTHIHPSSGFQYRASTYWSYQCIVGKVLGAARGVSQVAGWIGPCTYAPDLRRTECVRVRQFASPERSLTKADVDEMAHRTDPLGPVDDDYPINDYELLIPDTEDVTDAIRIEKLQFELVEDQARTAKTSKYSPYTWDAGIQFACGGESWPMRLKYNIDFITAFPCQKGPHVLFYNYEYYAIKVDAGLVDIRDWADRARGSYNRPERRDSDSSDRKSRNGSSSRDPTYYDINKVLAIEAFGVSDNEVFARAWCAQWGHSAIIANIKETCMACAIREAYAACVSVVILTEGGRDEERDQGVHV